MATDIKKEIELAHVLFIDIVAMSFSPCIVRLSAFELFPALFQFACPRRRFYARMSVYRDKQR